MDLSRHKVTFSWDQQKIDTFLAYLDIFRRDLESPQVQDEVFVEFEVESGLLNDNRSVEFTFQPESEEG